MGKAIRKLAETQDRAPALARTEVVGKAIRARLETEVEAALKRKSSSEAKLAGALRAVGMLSPQLRASMAHAAETMLRRKSFARDLYSGCLRTLAEASDARAPRIVSSALRADDAGGTATLGAACVLRDADGEIGAALSKIAASRQSHLAFSAETARVVRGESNGGHLLAIAPMIKEAHRIALCLELLLPLSRGGPVPVAIAPALAVLRQAERHLGRWLVLGEVAAKSGDPEPVREATQRSSEGPQSSRAAWSLALWALNDTLSRANGEPPPPLPQTRPTVELVARLSDRPSADRDPSFLFRMAAARASTARPMLEGMVKGAPLRDASSIRAAMYLARDHGRDDLRAAIAALARGGRPEELRGVATAAVWDLGMKDEALGAADELAVSKLVTNVAWAALVRAAAQGFGEARPNPHLEKARPKPLSDKARPSPLAKGVGDAPASGSVARPRNEPLLTEVCFRWVQSGWLE